MQTTDPVDGPKYENLRWARSRTLKLHLVIDGRTKCGQRIGTMKTAMLADPWSDRHLCANCAYQFGPPDRFEPMVSLRDVPLRLRGTGNPEPLSAGDYGEPAVQAYDSPTDRRRLRRHQLDWRIVDLESGRLLTVNEAVRLMDHRERLGGGDPWASARPRVYEGEQPPPF